MLSLFHCLSMKGSKREIICLVKNNETERVETVLWLIFPKKLHNLTLAFESAETF